ncbi:MAG: hypothetical protein HY782_01800 [Chloroflexi bacterium]|nr:hypothetical protein [Chloroflexota bacterium]
MFSPSLVLAFVIGSLYGLVFYLVFGRGWARIPLYWVTGLAGFALGQWLGSSIGLSLFNIGPVNLVEGTLVSWASLFAVRAWRR